MLKKTFFSFFLLTIIFLGIITTTVSIGSWNFLQVVDAQTNSKSRATAEAAIKKTYDALAATGLKGSPSALINTGEGFAKVFRDINGAIAFVIFWTPSTGAHEVHGAIMQTYSSEGWHLSDLGYPTSDEKDLAGVTNGRYNEFQNGVIAMIKGEKGQVFPTVQDAVAKLKVTQGTEPQVPVPGKYRMTLEVVVFGSAGTLDDKISAGFAIKPGNTQPILLTDSVTPSQLRFPYETPRDIGIRIEDVSVTGDSLSFSYVVTNKLGTQSAAIDVTTLPITILSSQGMTTSIAAAQTFLPQSVTGCEFIIAADEKVFTADEIRKKISQPRTSETKDGLVQTTGGGFISEQRAFDVKAPTGCPINYKMVGTIWTIRDLSILPPS